MSVLQPGSLPSVQRSPASQLCSPPVSRPPLLSSLQHGYSRCRAVEVAGTLADQLVSQIATSEGPTQAPAEPVAGASGDDVLAWAAQQRGLALSGSSGPSPMQSLGWFGRDDRVRALAVAQR